MFTDYKCKRGHLHFYDTYQKYMAIEYSPAMLFFSFMMEIQTLYRAFSQLKKIESKEKVFNMRLLPVLTVVFFLHK